MPETVYVTIDTSSSFIRIVDGIDPDTQLPFLYTNFMTEEDQVQRVDSRLIHFLDKNNVKRTFNSASAKYSITVDEIFISESSFTGQYEDTCWGIIENVDLVKLQYVLNVTLTNLETGYTFENIHLNETFREGFTEDEGCGSFSIREITMDRIHDNIAACLRKEITKIIYEDQGF